MPRVMLGNAKNVFQGLLKQSSKGFWVGLAATADIALFEGFVDEMKEMMAGRCQ
jgi:hypothetical protein